jgi:hypothetical protein
MIMRSRHHGVLLALAFAAGAAFGQDKGDKNAAASRPDANAIEVRFADDSTVKMALQHANVEVATRYGKLTVPISEIRRIEFGLRIPEETVKRVEAAVARLGSADFKQREAASAELLGLRELAYPALQHATRSTDLEVSRRAKDIIKTLVDTMPAERLHIPRHDTVIAIDFTIVGQVEAPAFKVRTPYFGETSLKLAEIRSMRWLANEQETKLAVDAARYGGQTETWLETGIELRAGAGLQVSAAGTVDLRPTAGDAGTYVVSPDGLMRGPRGGGGFAPGGGRAAAAGGRAGGPGLSPGALLGRVGEHGKVFVIGSRYEGTTTDEGKLFLRIVASPYNPESSGIYDVRVSAGR